MPMRSKPTRSQAAAPSGTSPSASLGKRAPWANQTPKSRFGGKFNRGGSGSGGGKTTLLIVGGVAVVILAIVLWS